MADEAETQDVDLSTIIPETFKGEDGKFDIDAFKTSYEDLSAFKSAEDDRASQLPKDADGYEFSIPEDHAFPEGFDPASMKTRDEEGNEVEFDVAKMIDPEDPDIPALKAALHEFKAPPALMGKLASIMANREIRNLQSAMTVASEETKALGPDAKNRISVVKRALEAKLPKDQAGPLLNAITTANALRGFEALMKALPNTTSNAPSTPDLSELKPMDRVLAGLNMRNKSA